jgi:hypothetical protein
MISINLYGMITIMALFLDMDMTLSYMIAAILNRILGIISHHAMEKMKVLREQTCINHQNSKY